MRARTLSKWMFTLTGFLIGSVLTLLLAVGIYFAVASYMRPARPAEEEPVYTRPEFSQKVMGKSEQEVIEAVGKPDETSEDNDSRYWHFKGRTRDPITDSKDTDVQVVFKDGRVAHVNY